MTAARRWCIVALGVLLVIATPITLRLLPASGSDVSAARLLEQIRASKSLPYSGYVESAGTLQLSVTGRFSSLTNLFSEPSRLRVWWRGADRWRVDTLRASGESDLFHDPDGTTRWSYESERATRSPNAPVRLPDASDLLPPTFATRVLSGARDSEVSRIDSQRIAGRSAPGIRLTPADAASSIDHVDIWADPDTGIPVRTELYAADDPQPSISSTFESLRTTAPELDTVLFYPPPGVAVEGDDAVDIAAAADRFAEERPPAQLAGLDARDDIDTNAVGVYGRGATALVAIPLWGRAARPLREQLTSSVGARTDADGVHLATGPLGLLLTPRSEDGTWLLVGTVTDDALTDAARDLAAR